MIELVMLPATEPDDKTYGQMPSSITGYPKLSIRHIHFPHMVWYNREIQRQAIAQIPVSSVYERVAVGFSKSGLGAWNIVLAAPELFSGSIIFDAPVTMECLPGWGTAPFYKNDVEWQADLPVRSIVEFRKKVPAKHKLILISGEKFHDQMSLFARTITDAGIPHIYIPGKNFKHHWNSGWIEEGLKAIQLLGDKK